MFKQIDAMLVEGAGLSMMVMKGANGLLTVHVRPVGESKNAVLGQGIKVVEKAEVLDAEMGGVLETYAVAHASLQEQVDDRVRVMEAAAEAEKAAKAEAIKKGAATKTGAPKGQAVAKSGVKAQVGSVERSAGAARAEGEGGEEEEGAGVGESDELKLF